MLKLPTVKPSTLVDSQRCFGQAYCIHLLL